MWLCSRPHFYRDCIKKIHGLNPENKIWWDAELLLDFSMVKVKMQVINDFLSIFTLHDRSISGQKYTKTNWAKILDLERERTKLRLYQKVMGHSYNKWTNLFVFLARIQKWLLQPEGSMWRVIDKIIFRSNV